jgi:glycosyltransferase involved in cell wall biosynthesis
MKIKLAILNRHFSKTAGGAESLAVSMATSMLPECEITVISQNFDSSLKNFKYIRVPTFFIRTRWLNQLWFSWYTKRLIQKSPHGFDVVHSFENITHGDVHTVSVKTVHASLKERGMSRLRIALSPRLLAYLWLEKKRMCTNGHHSVFVSQFVADETQAVLPHLFAKYVITPGVSIPNERLTEAQKAAAKLSFGLKPDVMTIGFVGHDFKKKGLDVLLSGAARLPFDVQILVFGKTDQVPRYADLVSALGTGKSCRFMGVVGDMPNAYAAMDCLAHPTKQDVFPMTLLEAMACHVPVLTTNEPYNNMGSLLSHGINASLLADPDDSVEMAQLLAALWQNKVLAETISSGGFAFAQNYSWDVSKAKYYEVYRHVMDAQAATKLAN